MWSVALDVAVGLEQTNDGQLRGGRHRRSRHACGIVCLIPVSESPFRKPTLVVEAGKKRSVPHEVSAGEPSAPTW